jgi:sulfur relay (sulfurtransferase) DsrC/TusE family protein
MESNQQSRGLGDTIERITTATGIKTIVKKVAKAVGKDDCGCEARRNKLNKIFPYNNPNKP